MRIYISSGVKRLRKLWSNRPSLVCHAVIRRARVRVPPGITAILASKARLKMRRNENDMMPSQYNEKESWKSPTRGMTPNTRPKTATPGLRLNRNPKTVHSIAQRFETRFVSSSPKSGSFRKTRRTLSPPSDACGHPPGKNCTNEATYRFPYVTRKPSVRSSP